MLLNALGVPGGGANHPDSKGNLQRLSTVEPGAGYSGDTKSGYGGISATFGGKPFLKLVISAKVVRSARRR
ncbi:hypothetical protein CHELA1G11_20718 [Hyphomicrobiales bacterium]|nr:hypothetical protein CHELA1G11_20718 [Hyphomicrobiales bacterium]CAH1691590.1 hypothetical protein CHELA1G2_21033 [Hyphomicrobiales bacterium]